MLQNNVFYLPYIPPVSWFSAVRASSGVVLEACENYHKGSWRNRCAIAGPNGMQLMSVPLLKGKHQQKPIREVRISYEMPWQRQHWRSIKTAYGNAPFFEHYADDLRPFFEKQPSFLFDLNLEWLHFFCTKWKWPLQTTFTEQYYPAGQWPEGHDYRAELPAVAARPYPQVFADRHPFLPDLSALDLLLCCGNHALEFI
jgi:hypothetical protein